MSMKLCPLVSIILPVYNGEKYLRESLDSVRNQTYQNWELILVDDCSSDHSPEIMNEYATRDSRITVVRHEKNRKLPGALNTGFRMAHGEFVTWTSDDNIFLEPALEHLTAILLERPEADIIYGRTFLIDQDGNRIGYAAILPPEYMPVQSCIGGYFLFKRKVYEAVGGYDETWYLVEDWQFWLKAFNQGFQFYFTEDFQYLYRVHDSSLSVSRNMEIRRLGMKLSLMNLSQWKHRYSREIISRVYLLNITRAKIIGDVDAGANFLQLAEAYDPQAGSHLEAETRKWIEGRFQMTLSKTEVLALIRELHRDREGCGIALFGAGMIGRIALSFCRENNIAVRCVADNSAALQGTELDGVPIVSPEELKGFHPILTVLASNYYYEMGPQLDAMGIHNHISFFLFKGWFLMQGSEVPGMTPAARACAWILRNQQESGGVSVYQGALNEYPEVTGYIIPTMLQYGYRDEALKMGDYLERIANPDGSFNAAGSQRAYLFDTAQALRGLNALQDVTNRYFMTQLAAADYLFRVLEQNDGLFPKSYEDDPIVPEEIMLFALPPMLDYAQRLNNRERIALVHRSARRYLQSPGALSLGSLTHFLAYQIDGLIDLGYEKEAEEALSKLLKFQREDGAIPAYEGADWVCTTGCAQLAICLYKIGKYEPANGLMDWLDRNMEADGGFVGGIGENADYYPELEIAWAVKFYLDAYKRRIRSHFDYEFSRISLPADAKNPQVAGIAAEMKAGDHVLEVGCGKGRILAQLGKSFPGSTLEGMDISPVMLSYCPEGIRTRVGDSECLPYPDDSFDLVFAVQSIEHSLNVHAAVREMYRVCRPGGKVVIIDKQLSNWGWEETQSWERWYDRSELEALLGDAGCVSAQSRVLDSVWHDDRYDFLVKWWGTKPGYDDPERERLVFFGAAIVGRLCLCRAEREGRRVDYVIDNRRNLSGTTIGGVPVIKLDELPKELPCRIFITVGSAQASFEIRQQLSERGYVEYSDFFEYLKIYKEGFSGFGFSSGFLPHSAKQTTIKGSGRNHMVVEEETGSAYRLIHPDLEDSFREIYRRCTEAGLFGRYLIPAEIAESPVPELYSLCFRHPYIPVFEYITEWSPAMIRDYILFMIDFLAELDRAGLGWSDGHPLNAAFWKGKFLFFDFDAITLGKTPLYYLDVFINYHIICLLMLSKGMLARAYLYLNNQDAMLVPSIQDIEGYLSERQLQAFRDMRETVISAAKNGDIQACCACMRKYVESIRMFDLYPNAWLNYQQDLRDNDSPDVWSDKQQAVIEMVRRVKPRTLLDLAGNTGWYEFQLKDEIERLYVADLSHGCIDYLYHAVRERGIKNIYPLYMNLITPTPDYYRDTPIGNTAIIPWRKNAIERFRSDMVLALAIEHHLVFSQQLDFDEIIGQFALYTNRWLLIEFMERNDGVVRPALENPIFDWYTQENFEKALTKRFSILSFTHSEPTRIVYLCEKR